MSKQKKKSFKSKGTVPVRAAKPVATAHPPLEKTTNEDQAKESLGAFSQDRRNIIVATLALTYQGVVSGLVGAVTQQQYLSAAQASKAPLSNVTVKAVRQLEHQGKVALPDRLDLIQRLFFPKTGCLELYPANDHPKKDLRKDQLTYPNEEQAMKAIRNLFGEAKEITDDKYQSNPHHSQAYLGSSISHKGTRMVLGHPDSPCFKYATSNFYVKFPYSIVRLDDRVTRLQDGEERETYNYAVIDSSRNPVVSTHNHGRLTGDVLLVTRIPRELGGADLLIFAGLHGPGVRAVENLLYEISPEDLDFLAKCIGNDDPYFQAIFRIPDLQEKDGTTVPVSIYCEQSELFRPRPVRVTYQQTRTSRRRFIGL